MKLYVFQVFKLHFLLFLLIASLSTVAAAQVGTVSSYQKISDTEGNFSGVLDPLDLFGLSVTTLGDLDGDNIADLVVGAPNDDDGGSSVFPNRGAVWVLFMNADGTVASHQKISATEGNFTGLLEPGDRFGSSVTSPGDLDGDNIPDLAVGMPEDDDPVSGTFTSGSVWVLFMNTDGTVASHQKISATEGNFTGALEDGDLFGGALASLGDLNGDSIPDLAVGTGDSDGGFRRGAVWILFMNADGTVASNQKISDTEGNFMGILDDNDQFGNSLASTDLNGDNRSDLVVGARFDDDGGSARGAVWVLFLNADGTVSSHQKISDTQGNFTGGLDDEDSFGYGLGSAGDLDGDSVGDLIVGAVSDDDGGPQRGAVWVLFMNADGTVASHQKISDTEGNFGGTLDDGDAFGGSVGSFGDLNGDNVPDIAVGAFNDDDGGSGIQERGAVWVLFLNGDDDGVALQAAIDVKPGECPNILNRRSRGIVNVAVLGSLDLDVRDIDVSSIRLEGIAPIRSSIEDVADAFTGEVNHCDDCTAAEPTEGFSDLVLKFDNRDLFDALGTITDSECRSVQLTGELNDGTPFEATDFVITRDP